MRSLKTIAVIISVLALLFSPITLSNATSAENTNTNQKVLESSVSQYLMTVNDSVYFNESLAALNNESAEIILAGKTLNSITTRHHGKYPVWTDKAGQGMFAGYRYCGVGNLGGKPTNVLDEGCRQHDNCYAERGYGKCSCDKEFISYIDKQYSRMKTIEKIKASGAKIYFQYLQGTCKK